MNEKYGTIIKIDNIQSIEELEKTAKILARALSVKLGMPESYTEFTGTKPEEIDLSKFNYLTLMISEEKEYE